MGFLSITNVSNARSERQIWREGAVLTEMLVAVSEGASASVLALTKATASAVGCSGSGAEGARGSDGVCDGS